jgi:hypothetical protein
MQAGRLAYNTAAPLWLCNRYCHAAAGILLLLLLLLLLPQGVDFMHMSASFVSGRYNLPTCASQTRFQMRFNQASTISMSHPKFWAMHTRPRPPSW